MQFEYTANYCEENIYKLLLPLSESLQCSLDELTVIFISNRHRLVPLWSQKLQKEPHIPVVWDYHVILQHQKHIYDFDSTLPFPCDITSYVEETFHPELNIPEVFSRVFRFISGTIFLKMFSSDRSHMLKDGEWISSPPTWGLIQNESCPNNLDKFIDMEVEDEEYGHVLQEAEFLEYCDS